MGPFLFEALIHRIQKLKKIAHPWPPADVMSLDQRSSHTCPGPACGAKEPQFSSRSNYRSPSSRDETLGYRENLVTQQRRQAYRRKLTQHNRESVRCHAEVAGISLLGRLLKEY